MQKIADYDEFHYDYKSYWDEREYENNAEIDVLNQLLKDEEGDYFVDIGGSFGRNAHLYAKKYKHPIIVDYSLETLQKYRESIQKEYPNMQLIAANAYKLPFKDSVVDGAMMIRVLHHLSDPEGVFREASRILKENGAYILEFANKIHIKARLKWIFSGQFHNFSTTPYQQPTQKNYEGSKEGEDTVFLNFHPKDIKEKLEHNHLFLNTKAGASFLRIEAIKRKLSPKSMMTLEKIMRPTLSWMDISPSIFFKCIKQGSQPSTQADEILCCPKCHGDLNVSEKHATCKECKTDYLKKKDIWDFRI